MDDLAWSAAYRETMGDMDEEARARQRIVWG